MPHVRDRAICLRKLDYSETSQILTLFTRDLGLLTVIAKGARRTTKTGSTKFDGGLDLLDLGEAVFIHSPEKEMSTLTEWHLEAGHLPLRDSLRALYLGQYAAELISLVFEEGDPHPDVFDDLAALLPQLQSDQGEAPFIMFLLRLLWSAGLFPELRRCVGCSRQAPDESQGGPGAHGYFSPAGGGVVCANCELAYPDRQQVNPQIIRLMRAIAAAGLPRAYSAPMPPFSSITLPPLTRAETDPVHRIFLSHLRQALGKSPRLSDYIV